MLGKDIVLNQIDVVLKRYGEAESRSKHDDLSDLSTVETSEIITLLAATIARVAPPASPYRESADAAFREYGRDNTFNIPILSGILQALKHDYVSDHMQAVYELIHADVFADFLDMADHLLEEGYKDRAAVMGGGVLEEHLRKLYNKHIISTSGEEGKPKKVESMNADLCRAKVYSNADQKNVTAWYALRNKAAHARYSEYTKEQVALLIQSIRDFISRHPA